MASKNELLEIIRDNGLSGNASMTKAELQEIVDGLLPSTRQPEEKPEEQAQPDLNEEENPEEIEEEKTGEDNEETPPPQSAQDFDELLGKIKGAEAPSPKSEKKEASIFEKKKRKSKKGESDPDSFRMQGYLLLLATDTIFPAALSFANNMLDKKHKISVAELKLNDRDFASLEPIADQAADYMSININPIAGFFIMASFLYANNIIILKMEKNN
jgi:hypothetical protein